MGRNRKELYYGSRSGTGAPRIRMSVSDRASKAARPWNHPDVVNASQAYGVNLASYKDVSSHEDKLEAAGSLEPHERMTCVQCGNFNKECKCTEEWK
jgi:hypothetical protein